MEIKVNGMHPIIPAGDGPINKGGESFRNKAPIDANPFKEP